MTYAETLAYLYAQLPMFQRVGKAAYKADLSNTLALMQLTGHPERGLRCVHVAGTNGKGSTSHMLASILQEAGYKVGLHTSPHLKDFRERFRINGGMIPETTVTRFVEGYRSGFEPINASFFEWGVALALWWFREEAVDIAIIETGMGGRLDSTNVISPDACVITNIGYDHMDFLGTTLEAIAGEKAGIVKPGVPIVIGEADSKVRDVFERKAREVAAPITFIKQSGSPAFTSSLAGAHQVRNTRTVLGAVDALRQNGWTIPAPAIERGLAKVVANTGLMGRWQVLAHAPLVVADVAHNEDGFRALNAQLDATPSAHVHIVLGMVGDKDLTRALAMLPKEATYYFCRADLPRALPAKDLATKATDHGLRGIAFPSVAAAVSAARTEAKPDELVLITGSVFVVAEAL